LSAGLAELVQKCIRFSRRYDEIQRAQAVDEDPTLVSSLGFSCDALSPSSTTTAAHIDDPHAVSIVESQGFYAGLPSDPVLIYRSDIQTDKWSPHRKKQLCPVFNHPIVSGWNDDLGWKVVAVLDARAVCFTSIDVVRFKLVEVDEDEETAKEARVGPVTIWIGVFADWTPPTLAHEAAQDVLALLEKYNITDVNIHFRESIYTTELGPRLLQPIEDVNPLVDVIGDVVGPLTTALGLHISTKARPNTQGTMALYLKKGGDSKGLLGLSCRHVLIDPNEPNELYVHHRNAPIKDVLLLGHQAYTKLVTSIKVKVADHGTDIERWQKQINEFKEREQGSDVDDVAKALKSRAKAEEFVKGLEEAIQQLAALLGQVEKHWKPVHKRVIGHVLHSPPIALGVGQPRFTEDWGLLELDEAKLGNAYQGNKLDLGTEMKPAEFTRRCLTRGNANWKFTYPKDRLLPLVGIISDQLMRHPDMSDSDDEPCLLVVKSGNATGTTLGRANGVFSIVRKYSLDTSIDQTSMGWAILPYDSKSGAFSAPGDSGSIIADIRGRIGGMLTGGSGNTKSSDVTYATPWFWLLEQIQATKEFTNVHVA
ncbi:hypothetical protein FRC17_008818, partial [Serendipita sp. 399]